MNHFEPFPEIIQKSPAMNPCDLTQYSRINEDEASPLAVWAA